MKEESKYTIDITEKCIKYVLHIHIYMSEPVSWIIFGYMYKLFIVVAQR